MQRIRKYFPRAQFALEVKQRINFSLLKEGGQPSKTLFACSVCPDEINHYPTSLNYRLARGAGKCFYMGGLAGIPFVGRVGYNAFTAHIPNDGNLVVLFAPHVGCSPEGDLGLFLRDGQSVYDNACKEAIAAYKWLQSNQWEPIHDKNAPVVVPKDTDPY